MDSLDLLQDGQSDSHYNVSHCGLTGDSLDLLQDGQSDSHYNVSHCGLTGPVTGWSV